MVVGLVSLELSRTGGAPGGLAGLGQCLPPLPPRRAALGGLCHVPAACSGVMRARGVRHPSVTTAGTPEVLGGSLGLCARLQRQP